ncbi:MAG: DUF418 domain-containing protein [Acidobacteriales bacterium]|nr:DUF418 domain-containing protein [Terriglobales bacterium]
MDETVSQPLFHPVAAPERLGEVDLLRGWALLGILLVNMNYFAWPVFTLIHHRKWTSPADVWAEILIGLFAQGKFYTLFSFLFGFGFSIFLIKGERAGRGVTWLFARRLLVLLGIGAVHAFFVWSGDILMTYALIGFLLLLFRRASPRTLLIWALVLTLLPTLFMTAGYVAISTDKQMAKAARQDGAASEAQSRAVIEESMRAMSHGSFAEITRVRSTELLLLYRMIAFFGPNILGMFLLGLWAGKVGLLHRVNENLGFMRRLNLIGLMVGLPLSAVAVWSMHAASMMVPSGIGVIGALAGAIGNPALCAFYASFWVLLYQDPRWQLRLLPMTRMGRMALTNYLLQSLICTTIFYSTGFGLFGHYGPALTLPLVFVIYFAEMRLSVWWLERYQFGPAEWLWRTLTYGQVQPMKTFTGAVSEDVNGTREN